MNMRDLYKKNDHFSKTHWFRIVIISLVIIVITNTLSIAFGGQNAFNKLNEMMMYGQYSYYGYDEMDYLMNSFGSMAMQTAGLSVLIGVLKNVLDYALSIELKNNYELETEPRMDSTVAIVKGKGLKLLLLSFVKTILMGAATFIFIAALFVFMLILSSFTVSSYDSYYGYDPYYSSTYDAGGLIGFLMLVGFVLLIIGLLYVEYGIGFASFLIDEDEELDVIDAVKESFKQTKGQKFGLFKATFRYVVYIVGPFIASFILSLILIGLGLDALAVFIVILGFISIVVLAIYYLPNTLAITGVYYIEMHRKLIDEYAPEEVEVDIVVEETVTSEVDVESSLEKETEETIEVEVQEDSEVKQVE